MVKTAVIIPAAGIGKRMNAPIPKTFLEIAGRPVIYYTIKRFLEIPDVAEIIIATSEELKNPLQKVIAELSVGDVSVSIVNGGKERQDSVKNALNNVQQSSIVAVHDAVRPLFSKTAFEKAINLASSKYDGAILAVPARDTIKKVKSDFIIQQTPERSELWQAQTPQVFKLKVLLDAFENAVDNSFFGTDDASLVEFNGGRVVVVEGNHDNIKITYPSDLVYVEHLMKKENGS